MNRVRIIAFALCLVSVPLAAQKSKAYGSAQTQYNEALDLYEAGFYGAARTKFAQFQKDFDRTSETILTEESRYYEALSAKNLRNADAPELMKAFVNDCAQSTRRHDMLYHLGDYYLIGKDEAKALTWFVKADCDEVTPKLRNDLLFKTGYCYFMRGKHTRALSQFDKMRNNGGKYAGAVKYYRAHVDYEQGNLDVAMKAFVELEKDEAFSTVAPYYIAHISYLQGRYSDAIRYAEPLAKGNAKKNVDMQRIVADSHFALGEYSKAIGAYDALMSKTRKINRADYYHYGMSLYKTGNYAKAAENLSKVTSGGDELAQNAHYHLADCYLRTGDKKRARTAFEAASKPNFDKAIKEDAHFNKLKLAYELSFSPFGELITELVEFTEQYPQSDKIDEAYDLMSKALVSTKNYRQALATMEKIQHKNLRIYTALQRVSFYRGLELYTNSSFDEATEFFDYSLKYGDYDRKLRARAYYWKGECQYRTGNTNEARELYTKFLSLGSATELSEFQLAHYNIAYTYFNQKNYNEAKDWFIRFTGLDNKGNETILADAYNRLGDCLYAQRNFKPAIEYYDKALATSSAVGDYSMLQKGICLGLTQDNEAKIDQLDQLIKRYPKSAYSGNAYFETARAHVALNNIKEAIYNYKVVKERYPKSSLASKAMLQLGLLYYNNDEYENSIAFYKRVINEYPSTPEAADALAGLRNVYMDRGDFDGYMAYASTLGSFARVELHEQDSLMFTSAQRLYLRGDYENARPAFEKYLDRFSDGRFATAANFYLGDCHYQKGEMTEARAAYDYVAAQPRSIFTEDALLRGGELHYKAEDYNKALTLFERLENEAEVETNRVEAIIGQMRCMQKMNNTEACIMSADKVIEMPQASPEILREAKYLKMKSLIAVNRQTEAIPLMRELGENTKSSEGSEAKYLLAQTLYDQKSLDSAEAEIFDYVDKGTPHQYWLARSFVLLADIYHAKNDDFQAQQYLENLRETYTADDDISDMIASRLGEWNTGSSKLPTDQNDSVE